MSFYGFGGLSWWRVACHLKNVCVLWAVTVFSSFRLLFICVDFECNRPSFLVTVFRFASAFNGDISKWDVGIVTDMSDSKSICIVVNG